MKNEIATRLDKGRSYLLHSWLPTTLFQMHFLLIKIQKSSQKEEVDKFRILSFSW